MTPGVGRGIALIAVLALASCGGDDDDDATATPDGTGAATTSEAPATTEAGGPATTGATDGGAATTDAPATTDGEATPAQGGEITVGTIFDAFGLEPTTFLGGVNDLFIGHGLYDPLVIRTVQGEVEPWLAESIESDDRQTYTITLHEGVMFTDGTPLDAEAVKVNIERHMDPANKSRALGQASNIESITVVDPQTLTITLKFPWSAFPEVLAGALGFIASPTAIAGGNLNTAPVGSGPFVLEERVPGDHTTLVRNDDYWRDGEPYLDRITFRVILDNDVREESVANGEIQVAQSIRADTLAEANETDGLSATMTAGNGNTIHTNTTRAPTDDVRVRQALAYALDYEALNDVIFDGAAEVTHSFIVEDSPFNDAVRRVAGVRSRAGERARRGVRGRGGADPVHLPLLHRTGVGAAERARDADVGSRRHRGHGRDDGPEHVRARPLPGQLHSGVLRIERGDHRSGPHVVQPAALGQPDEQLQVHQPGDGRGARCRSDRHR